MFHLSWNTLFQNTLCRGGLFDNYPSHETRCTAHKENEIQKVLNEELHRLRLRNPSYSLRAFARKLSMAPSALSEILQGKRAVSRKTAVSIANALMMSPAERDKLLKLFPEHFKRAPRGAALTVKPSNQLMMDQYRTISEWFHFAILSLAETTNFQSDISWIAQRLRLSKVVASSAVNRLLRLKLLQQKNGAFSATGLSYATPDGIAEVSLRRAHATNLDLAKASLERDSLEERDFTSMTMAIDPRKIPEAKKRIREFQKELCAFLESGEQTEVYKVCTQFFPLTTKGEHYE